VDDPTVTMRADLAHTVPGAGGGATGNWGPFQLVQKVGQGSFGEVYRAYDTTLQREVALKLLLPRGLDPEAEKQALLQEARALARVRNPNVVPVYGVDTHDGRVGFWSDFVNGKTLSAIVAADGPFGPREAALIGVDLCKAIGAVHAAGLLHRDIKSGNVMRENGGRILLMDFGLTHDREGGAQHRSGTPVYMAPELIKGQPASVASDLYALGILLFYLLTGKYPIDGNTFPSISAAHETGARLSLLDARPDLPEPLARVVETAAHADPAKRYKSAGQLIGALTEAVGLSPVSMELPDAPVAKPSRAWVWPAVAVVALSGIAVSIPPVRHVFFPEKIAVPIAGVQDDYQKAHDLVEHYYRPQAAETAIPLLEKVIEKDPNFAPAYADLGRANMTQFTQLRDTKYLEPTRLASLRALGLKPDLASAHVTLGMLYTWTGKNDLASQELDQALKIDKYNASAYAALGSLLLRQGRNDEAQANLQKAVNLAPEDWGVVGQLASYYSETGQFAQAREQYEKAVQLAPDNPRALNNLGLAYRSQGRMEEAESAYRKSIALDPTAGHYRNLGQTLLEDGKAEEARQMLERSVGLKADNHRAWGFLAAAYVETGVPRAKVEETYRKAVALGEVLRKESPDGYLYADLANYYANLGMHKQGEALLKLAIARTSDSFEVLYGIALAYELLKDRDQALAFLQKAVMQGMSPQFIARNSQLSALRADPRYQSAIDRAQQDK
jgi:eukaryotic-like serine/threonine-protein kinase